MKTRGREALSFSCFSYLHSLDLYCDHALARSVPELICRHSELFFEQTVE